jgi:hypothetical protein
MRWNPTLWITERGELYSKSGQDFITRMLTVLPVIAGLPHGARSIGMSSLFGIGETIAPGIINE